MKIESSVGRRTFLKGAAIFGGLTALFGLARPAVAGPKEEVRRPEHSGRGYRLTEHVKRYYKTARL